MPVVLVAEQTIKVGEETVLEGHCPASQFGAVFEDDGETGYFYGLDFSKDGNPIVDSLHLYNVADVVDKDVPSQVRIGWSQDGLKAVVDINGLPHAVFDFAAKRGYCHTAFPPPASGWSGHEWDDAALALFE